MWNFINRLRNRGRYREVKGDLLLLFDLGKFDAIVHGCNCFHTMGAGIAGQISLYYPSAYQADLKTLRGDKSKLGTYTSTWISNTSEKGGVIINAYTQYEPGKNLDYEALARVLHRINEDYSDFHIGFPQIGCGIAGGDWEIVRAMIRDYMTKCRVTVVIYEP